MPPMSPQVRKVTEDNVKKGYILPVDAQTTIREAEESRFGSLEGPR